MERKMVHLDDGKGPGSGPLARSLGTYFGLPRGGGACGAKGAVTVDPRRVTCPDCHGLVPCS